MVRSMLFSLMLMVGCLLQSLSSQAQSISGLSVAYVLDIPVEGKEAQANQLKIQALFTLQGAAQLSAVEAMLGSGAGKEEGGKFMFQVEEKSGSYYLTGSTGSFKIVNGAATIILPVLDQQTIKYVTLSTLTTAGAKAATISGVLN